MTDVESRLWNEEHGIHFKQGVKAIAKSVNSKNSGIMLVNQSICPGLDTDWSLSSNGKKGDSRSPDNKRQIDEKSKAAGIKALPLNHDASTPLTTKNLGKLREAQEESSDSEWQPTPVSIDERLKQARNYFSDEDINVCRDFAKRHKEIGNYLAELASTGQQCDLKVYNEVKNMFDLHQSRMDKHYNQYVPPFDKTPLVLPSQRLSLVDTSDRARLRGAPLRDDHPPFTIERPADHNAFLRMLHGHTAQGKQLRTIDDEAYWAAMADTSLVNQHLEERDSQDQEHRFKIRATKRGYRRAALQIALRCFAGNQEQHFEGDWKHRVLRLPSSPATEPIEPIMFVALDAKDQPQHAPPFKWTKKNLLFQKEQREIRLALGNADTSPTSLKFSQPALRKGMLFARYEARYRNLALKLFDILYLAGMTNLKWNRRKKTLQNPKGHATTGPGKLILDLIIEGLILDESMQETFRASTLSESARTQLAIGYAKTDTVWHKSERNETPDWKPLSKVEIEEMMRDAAAGQSRPGVALIVELGRLNHQLINRNFGPESPRPEKLGRQVLRKEREALRADRSQEQKKSGLSAPLQELARPLNGDKGLPSQSKALELLTTQILKEHHENNRPHKLNHEKIWAFAEHLREASKKQSFFSMNRWYGFPPPASPRTKRKSDAEPEAEPSPKRQHYAEAYDPFDLDSAELSRRLDTDETDSLEQDESSRGQTPELGNGAIMPPEIMNFDVKKHKQMLKEASDTKETHYKGQSESLSAETGFLQAAMQRQIESDLAGDGRFPSLLSPPPNLPLPSLVS
ncbi:hypothetical protein MMC12_001429 [Toensbergia leucococca]|nr:hypothetical protein [Toensbergia leucococca]